MYVLVSSSLAKFITPKTHLMLSSKEPKYYNGSIKFLSISDMTFSGKFVKNVEKSITELGLSNSSARLFPAGTLMYAMYASLGKCYITQVETAISQAILGFVLSG